MQGWQIGVGRVERIWRREGLKVPQKQPKRGRLCLPWLNRLFRMRTIITPHWRFLGQPQSKYTYYGPFKTKAEAEASRVARAMMSYRDILGDIPGMVRQWEKLVLVIGTHQQKSDAIRLVKELGVRR